MQATPVRSSLLLRLLTSRFLLRSRQVADGTPFLRGLSGSLVTSEKANLRLRNQSHIPVTSGTKTTSPPNSKKWPVAIFLHAQKAGLLKITADAAVKFMRDFRARGSVSADDICRRHNVKPNDLTFLARVMLRTKHTTIGLDMLMAAAELNDEEAVFLVMEEAMRRDGIRTLVVDKIYKGPFKRMLGEGHPRAHIQQAQLYEHRGHRAEALRVYEKLVSNPAKELETQYNAEFGDAWFALGRLRLLVANNRRGARAAIEKAALQHDNLKAYYELGINYTKQTDPEREHYLLKAAASGETKAAHELGTLYFSQSQGIIPIPDIPSSKRRTVEDKASESKHMKPVDASVASKRRNLARQWFAVGAESDNTGSQVYMAILHHKLGELAEGRRWLEAALKSKGFSDWTTAAKVLAANWTLPNADFTKMDVRKLRRGLSVNLSLDSSIS